MTACLPPSYSPIVGQCVVELAVPDAVEKALPLVPVIDQDPPRRVAGHPHQHPVRTGVVRPLARPGLATPPDHGNLDRAVSVTRAAPVLSGDVDAQLFHGRLAGHGTPPRDLAAVAPTSAWTSGSGGIGRSVTDIGPP